MSAPHWFLVLVLLIAPLRLSFVRLKGRSRFRAGRCVACGYDLRASPDRCPECGTTPKSQVTA